MFWHTNKGCFVPSPASKKIICTGSSAHLNETRVELASRVYIFVAANVFILTINFACRGHE